MHVVQRHPHLRLEVLRRAGRSTAFAPTAPLCAGWVGSIEIVRLRRSILVTTPYSAKAAEVMTVSSAVPAKPILATVMAISGLCCVAQAAGAAGLVRVH